ncbi:MAG: M16 family metallopeptidase [Bacteroidia bacterium]
MTKNNRFNIITLDNGMRVVHQQIKSTQLVHCGLFIKTGSRDEDINTSGSAHFIEHALFKGTKKRRASQLFNRIESVGGELNAYTTREITSYYASSLKRYVDRSFDLLSDMCFNSLLDPKELDKERKVIFEEIEMYEDSPDESIYDDFFMHLFKNQPLGYNILGTKQSLAKIGQTELRSFISHQYQPKNMVFSVAGNVSAKRVESLAHKYLNITVSEQNVLERKQAQFSQKFNIEVEKDFQQSHCIYGGKAYSRYNDRRYALMLLNNILGGSNMGSRLNLSVREKHGFCYHISSTFQTFDDSGIFFVQFASDKKNVNKTIDIINKEFKIMREKPLGPLQLTKAKRQLQGNLAIMFENPGLQMQNMAKGILNFNNIIDLKEVFEAIDTITTADIQQVAIDILNPNNLSKLVFVGNND